MPYNPKIPPIITNTNLSNEICGAKFGKIYIVIILNAATNTAGLETNPASTAVPPNTNAATKLVAAPKCRGIRKLASYIISNSTNTIITSNIGENGVFSTLFVITHNVFNGTML